VAAGAVSIDTQEEIKQSDDQRSIDGGRRFLSLKGAHIVQIRLHIGKGFVGLAEIERK
jgi:hypothetical protein